MTDRTPRTDPHPANDPARIPQPDGRGAGSHELETASDDPAILRQVIERARERLAFYESFDRIIGENIRRSGELMLETIALREQAQAAEDARLARESDINRARQSERERTHAMLVSLRDEVSAFQATTATLAGKIDAALGEFANPAEDSAAMAPESSNETGGEQPLPPLVPETPATTATPATSGETAPNLASEALSSPRAGFRPIRTATAASATSKPAAPAMTAELEHVTTTRTIDLVVNSIARATTALAFQRELAKLPGIIRVETREFAESVLRLSVEIASEEAISDEAFAAWNGPGTVSVVTRQPTLIALDLTEA